MTEDVVSKRIMKSLRKFHYRAKTFIFQKSLNSKQSDDIVTISIQSLAPTSNASKNEVYDGALKTAIENSDILNIGITGPYGSGKSSVIKTFETKYSNKKRQFLNISLATIIHQNNNGCKKDLLKQNGDSTLITDTKNKDQEIDQSIELSIIQQLFYRVKATKIPFSRFSRINPLSFWQLILISIGIILFSGSFLIVFFPEYLKKTSLIAFDWHNNRLIVAIFGVAFFILGSIIILSRLIIILKNSKLNRLNFKNGEIEIGCPAERSILNRYLDEIIYFFEKNYRYNVVVFEDIDRFDDPGLFLKLREINSLINNSETIRKRRSGIKFIYALNDELFKGNDRTKFFDVLIPIIPIINTTNSGDKLKEQLKKIIPNHDVSIEFIQDIQLYIDDMRLLNNICNEFLIYQSNIGGDLDQTRLFSMIVFKNIYPEDFAQLHNSRGKVYNALNSWKKEFVKKEITDLRNKTIEIQEKIEIEKNLLANSEKELRYIYIGHLWNKFSSPQIVTIQNQDYYFHQLLEDSPFEQFRKNGITRYLNTNGTYIKSSWTFEKNEDEINTELNFDTKLDAVRIKSNNEKEKLTHEKTEIEKEIHKIERWSLNEILKRVDIIDINNVFKEEKYNLLGYLLSNGFINEDYEYYLSYFYSGNLTQKDREFLLALKNKKVLEFGFKLSQVPNVVHRIFVKDLNTAVLNIDLLDYLLKYQETCETILNYFVFEISNGSERSKDFIEAFINQGENIGLFIALLCRKWDGFWEFMKNESGISGKRKEYYFELIFTYSHPKNLNSQNIDNVLTYYISKKKDILSVFTPSINNTLISYIKNHSVKIELLNEPVENNELLRMIYLNNSYIINNSNISFILKHLGNENSELDELLLRKNFTTILKSNCEELISYIEDNFEDYITDAYSLLSENDSEDESSILYLLNQEISEELKNLIIDGWNDKISDIELVDEAVWSYLFKKNKVKPLWDNLLKFYRNDEKNENRVLPYSFIVNFLNEPSNYKALSTESINSNPDFGADLIAAVQKGIIFSNDVTIDSFNSLLNAFDFFYENIGCKGLSQEKVELLIRHGALFLSPENYEDLKINFPHLLIKFIEFHSKDFYESIDDFELDTKNIIEILNSIKFDNIQKQTIIQKQPSTIFEGETELANSIIELLVKSDKVILSNEYVVEVFKNSPLKETRIILLVKLLRINRINHTELLQLTKSLDYPFNELLFIGRKKLKIPNSKINAELIGILKTKYQYSTIEEKKDWIDIWRLRKKRG